MCLGCVWAIWGHLTIFAPAFDDRGWRMSKSRLQAIDFVTFDAVVSFNIDYIVIEFVRR